MRLRLALCSLAAACALAPSAALAKRALSLDDLPRVRTVRDPQRSPDGKWVAYVVGTLDTEKDKRDSDIWMVSWDGKEQVRLTSSPESESMPRWSPDGRYLAFLASRGDEDEKKKGAQVWLLNRAGGEAQKLTDVKGGVSDYAWSPNSKQLVLACEDFNPNDDPEKKEGWKRKTAPPIVIDRYHFKEDREGYLGPEHTHLYLFDVEGKRLDILTSGNTD
jgi:dipeptidyl aminopeptidase/acylaminoacyl peptidase